MDHQNDSIYENTSTLIISISSLGSNYAQSCTTGKVDDRAAKYLATDGNEKSLQQLMSMPMAELRKVEPHELKKISGKNIQRIKITDQQIQVNVINAGTANHDITIIRFHGGGLLGMAPSLIITTEFDVLRDEGITYGKKMEKAGNRAAIKCYPHQLHGFASLPDDAEEKQRVYELMDEIIKFGLER